MDGSPSASTGRLAPDGRSWGPRSSQHPTLGGCVLSRPNSACVRMGGPSTEPRPAGRGARQHDPWRGAAAGRSDALDVASDGRPRRGVVDRRRGHPAGAVTGWHHHGKHETTRSSSRFAFGWSRPRRQGRRRGRGLATSSGSCAAPSTVEPLGGDLAGGAPIVNGDGPAGR